MYYKLVLVNTAKGVDQTHWTLKLPATVGRDPELDVCINHESISRTHCRLFLSADDALVVRDLGSTNGTYVHDERITQTALMPGDILQLGSITLRVEFTSDTDPGRPARKSPAQHLSATQPIPARGRQSPTAAPRPSVKKWWQLW